MNLSALRTAVRTRLGVTATDAFFDDTSLTELINAALHELETERDWYWYEASTTFSTVAGTATYALPASWKRTRELRVTDKVPIEWKAPPAFDELYYDSAVRGVPRHWTYYNSQLVL